MTKDEVAKAVCSVAEELGKLTECIRDLGEALKGEEPVKAKAKAKAKEAAEEPAPAAELKLEDVRKVLAEKSRAGFMKEVKAVITKYGADKLSDVKPEDYEALLKEAEVIGNG